MTLTHKAFTSIALGALATLSVAAAASADVIQTTTGIQQSEQIQFADGVGTVIQNSTNGQRLQQRSEVRTRRRGRRSNGRRSIQQTATGVQTNVQAQEAFGGDVLQNTINVDDLIQDTFAD